MIASELRQKYLKFFESKGHKIIHSALLVPENDPTTLFVSAGMQPMLPYFLGEKSPFGIRVVDSQKCIRTADIEEVGDNRHQTFFEMLGNWSFGDYFKKDQLAWIFEFLIKEVKINPNKLYVSVFAGDEKYNLPKDKESVEIWKELFANEEIDAKDIELGSLENASEKGLQDGRIFYYDQKKNWWTRSSSIKDMPPGEPGGPCSEMFYEFSEIEHNPKYGTNCHPNCDCGRYLEIGNSVFMQYQKQADETLTELPNKNVDYGGGVERLVMIDNNQPDVFQTDLFLSVIEKIEKITGKKYEENQVGFRIIADHLKASVFLILDGVLPSNKLQGYVLRRLLRRAMVKMHSLSGKVWNAESLIEIIELILKIYQEIYVFDIEKDLKKVSDVMVEEMQKFALTLERGLKEVDKIISQQGELNGLNAFTIYESYGFPLELLKEILKQKNIEFSDESSFENAKKAHQELSQKVSAGMFKGGLGEHSEITTKYHTATHLLHAALRKILGDQVQQKGSNITSERLRFDFSYPEKLSAKQIQEIENLVNQKIQENLPVTFETMGKEEALKSGALGFFLEKYGDNVTVYTIGHPERAERVEGSIFSREICGGPHVKNTADLGNFKIQKEESVSSGIRRIYAVLSDG